MITISVIQNGFQKSVHVEPGPSLLDMLRENDINIYAPCGGKGTCGKCRVNIPGEGEMLACIYYPDKDIKVILPDEYEAKILTTQTEFLYDLPFQPKPETQLSKQPYGAAIDIGTTTVVMYFLNLLTGQIESISAFINPQNIYGSDVVSRINYVQENSGGLKKLHNLIIKAINEHLKSYLRQKGLNENNIEKLVAVGNTTMLHLFLNVDPVSIALAPFTPRFTDKQTIRAGSLKLLMNHEGKVTTLPNVSAYVGADILVGLTAIKTSFQKYLFIDIGTNGEMALVNGQKVLTCATAAGPAFEGANLFCGTGAINGAIAEFTDISKYKTIGNANPVGICGSGIVDILAYLISNELVDETGLLKEDPYVIHQSNQIQVTQQDIREIQLAKSAVMAGIRLLLKHAGINYDELDALFLAGGFGNYINIESAIQIGLLPKEMRDKIYPIGNSAGIGALQYLKSAGFEQKVNETLQNTSYIELSNEEDFPVEFAMNMNFDTQWL